MRPALIASGILALSALVAWAYSPPPAYPQPPYAHVNWARETVWSGQPGTNGQDVWFLGWKFSPHAPSKVWLIGCPEWPCDPGDLCVLVVGFSESPQPAVGGILLPSPDIVVPFLAPPQAATAGWMVQFYAEAIATGAVVTFQMATQHDGKWLLSDATRLWSVET